MSQCRARYCLRIPRLNYRERAGARTLCPKADSVGAAREVSGSSEAKPGLWGSVSAVGIFALLGMKSLLEIVMTTNAVLFFFGAVQHARFAIGRFHEPRSISQLSDVTANLIALFGVVLGTTTLALGAGPRIASNDLYHKMMLIMIGATLLLS